MRCAQLLIAGGALGLAAITGAAPAAAVPPQAVISTEVLKGTDTAGGAGFCPFAVRLDITDNQNYVFTTLEDGSTALTFRGAARVTLTNVDDPTRSITLNASGPGDALFRPVTGTLQSGNVRGLNFLRTTAANSFRGVPPLNYTRGKATFAVAPDGTTTNFVVRGRSTDLCALLS